MALKKLGNPNVLYFKRKLWNPDMGCPLCPAPDSLSLSFMFYFEIITKHGSNFNYLLSIHSFPSLENTNVINKVQYTHKIL